MSTLFKYFYNSNKIKYRFEKIKDIIKLDYHTPGCQRRINNSRVSFMKEEINKNFVPVTPIYFCNWKKERYVIDGQHRLQAYSQNKDVYDKKIPVVEIFVEEQKDIYDYFLLINEQLVVNDVWKVAENKKDIILKTYDYFAKKYPKSFGWGNRPNKPRPYLHADTFMTQLTYLIRDTEEYDICQIYDITNSEDFIRVLEDLNKKYSEQKYDFFPKKTNTPNQKILEKIKNKNMLYFGMLQNNWMDYIVIFPPEPIPDPDPPMTQALRQACWVKWMGNNFKKECWCCHINEITPFNFEAGHVKAKAMGGKNTIENLRPICGFCNKAMGTKNMFQFMKEMNYSIPEDL